MKSNHEGAICLSQYPMNVMQTKMIEEQLIGRGVTNREVIRAFFLVPRHLFVREQDQFYAYDDNPLPIGFKQTISQPYIVAIMVEGLKLKPTDRVLEIGTGSGYQTAILSSLAKEVFTIERIPQLLERAKEVLAYTGVKNTVYKLGNGYEGWAEHAPYDAIIVSAAANEIPTNLLEELKVGGNMVIPTGGLFSQRLVLIHKGETDYTQQVLCDCRFVPMIDD